MRKILSLDVRLVDVAVIATLVAGGLVAAAAPAAAAPNFQLPFPCGQKWRLNTWDSGHAPALDMVREPQSATEGSLLVAPAAGTVNQSFLHGNAGHTIQINHGDRHFTTYIHLQSRSVSVGAKVAQGQTIGRVGHTGETSNGVPHLHYEQGYDANGDGRASWGFDGAERVTAGFNGKAYGPGAGGEWRNVESRNCGGLSDGGDFNADGNADIFSAATGTLTIWNGRGSNNFTAADPIGSGWTPFSRPIAGDFNDDGRSDLAAVRDGTLHIWNGRGGNTFAAPVTTGPGWTPYASTLMTLGDANDDGYTDIAAVSDGTLRIWNGRGSNNFTAADPIGSGWTAYSRPIAGDFDNDGHSDLAAVKDGTLHIWNGRGSNNFTAANPIGPGWTPYASTLMTLGDANEDGHTDIAAVRDGTFHIWNGRGGNGFTSPITTGPGWDPYF